MADPVYRPDARRDADAVEIADGAGQWLHITLREARGAFAAGTRFYGIPSSKADGSIYFTNFRFCSCKDYEQRGQGCKHQRAALLHATRVRQQRQQQAGGSADEADPTDRYAALYPPCKTVGCTDVSDTRDGLCGRCSSDLAFFERMAHKRAAVAGGR